MLRSAEALQLHRAPAALQRGATPILCLRREGRGHRVPPLREEKRAGLSVIVKPLCELHVWAGEGGSRSSHQPRGTSRGASRTLPRDGGSSWREARLLRLRDERWLLDFNGRATLLLRKGCGVARLRLRRKEHHARGREELRDQSNRETARSALRTTESCMQNLAEQATSTECLQLQRALIGTLHAISLRRHLKSFLCRN